MTAQEPQTKAGRALMDAAAQLPSLGGWRPTSHDWLVRHVLAIEAEAREQAERDIAALREALEAAGWWIVANAGPQDWWPESWRVERTELLDRIGALVHLKDTDEAEIRAEQ